MRNFPFATSFWFGTDIETAPCLEGQQVVDVAIIGGGFAGLSAAYHLKQNNTNLRIAIVDAKHVGYGASGRNAGWLMSMPPLMWMLDDFNNPRRLDDIRWAAQFCRNNIAELSLFVEREGIDCDWTSTHHTLVGRNPLEVATLRWIAPRFEAIGLSCKYYDKQQTHEFVGYPATSALTFDIVTIQPYKLARGLRQWLLRQGVGIYENTRIERIESTMHNLRLTTTQGASIKAEKVIVATNAYTNSIEMDAEKPVASVYHTYMLATEPLRQDLLDRISATQTPFGDPTLSFYIGRIHQNRLLFNGIDRASQNTVADDQHLPSFAKLYTEMLRRFPFLKSTPIAAAWGGAVQQNSTEAPIVRPAKHNPNIILNLGYGGGSGVGMALLSGRLTTDLVLNHSAGDPDAERLQKLYNASYFSLVGPARAATGVLKTLLFR